MESFLQTRAVHKILTFSNKFKYGDTKREIVTIKKTLDDKLTSIDRF
jgi:hypothetical protein